MPRKLEVLTGAAVAVAACLCALSSLAIAQPRPWRPAPRYQLTSSDSTLAAELTRVTSPFGPGSPGVAVALLRGADPPIIRYAGVESLDRRIPIGPETRFYIASLAKTVTATAALMLRERGALRLEDSLGRWIEGLPSCMQDVRIMHVLQHTSGIPDYYEVLGESTGAALDQAGILRFARGLRSLEFQPGVRYAYSNTGYVLLAEVIGRASRRSFAEYVQDSVLTPLGMTQTTVGRPQGQALAHRAAGYHRDSLRFVPDDPAERKVYGAGGMYSTLPDMVTWYRAVIESRLLKPASTALLFETPVTLSGRRSYLGMGWSNETLGPRTPKVDGLRAFGAFGVFAGFRSAILFYPDNGLAWIALSNAGEGALPPEGMAERLFQPPN